jgi:glycosyltransferase involved in cell wall biosynthesis
MAENPQKVILLIPNLQQGGAERQILELARKLPARFAPVLCLWNDEVHYRDLLPAGEPRHVLGIRRLGRKGLRRLEEVLREEKPSILHSYRDKANFLARLALRHSPVPVVLTSVRNRAINPLYLLTERYLSRRSDRVLVNSEAVRHELRGWARVPDSKIQIIHNFIDLQRFHPPSAEERAQARAHYNLASDELALLLPGRVSLQKNHMALVCALAWLRRRGRLPAKVRVLLAGRERDRLYAWSTWRLAALLGVDQHLVRLGAVTDMPALYHAADALLLPSLWEGLPNAVLEGHASGLPALVSHAANVDRIVLPGESGFEVPTLGLRSLAEALARLMGTPAEQLRRMGERGRAHVAATFGQERVLAETVALYDALLAEKGLQPCAG